MLFLGWNEVNMTDFPCTIYEKGGMKLIVEQRGEMVTKLS